MTDKEKTLNTNHNNLEKGQSYVSRKKIFIPIIVTVILLFSVFNLASIVKKASRSNTLEWLTEKGGINVIWGDKLSKTDTHGGFHGDGSSLEAYQYTDSSMQPEMQESDLWKELPLSTNIADLITNSVGDKCAEAIPDITNGYYFFYDRNPESVDPYDDSKLWDRNSINCTLALYDADNDVLYIYKQDT